MGGEEDARFVCAYFNNVINVSNVNNNVNSVAAAAVIAAASVTCSQRKEDVAATRRHLSLKISTSSQPVAVTISVQPVKDIAFLV